MIYQDNTHAIWIRMGSDMTSTCVLDPFAQSDVELTS